MPKRAESETIWHISDDLSIWPARILVIRRTRSSNVLRSELKATPGSTCLATSRQTAFSSFEHRVEQSLVAGVVYRQVAFVNIPAVFVFGHDQKDGIQV